jgi:hypothetical protein
MSLKRKGEWRYSSTILDLGIRRRWSASRPIRFIPGERAPGTHWIGGWVDPKAGLNAVDVTELWPLLHPPMLMVSDVVADRAHYKYMYCN